MLNFENTEYDFNQLKTIQTNFLQFNNWLNFIRQFS